jgi:hypothetical protein
MVDYKILLYATVHTHRRGSLYDPIYAAHVTFVQVLAAVAI